MTSTFNSGIEYARRSYVKEAGCFAELKLQIFLYKNYEKQHKKEFQNIENDEYLQVIEDKIKEIVDRIYFLDDSLVCTNYMFINCQEYATENDFHGFRFDQIILNDDELKFVFNIAKIKIYEY